MAFPVVLRLAQCRVQKASICLEVHHDHHGRSAVPLKDQMETVNPYVLQMPRKTHFELAQLCK